MADSPVTEGQILAGKYRVERVLGSGGMGFVVAAWHLELEQRVAVKFLHPLALERADTAERFRREARSAAKIRSEHVARVIDVGIMEGGVPYMVMEYLEGHDLADEMSRIGLLPIAEALDFVLQAIEALAEAHAAGIVHRDLKPANLFLAGRADGSRIVKVLDFGISKSLLAGSVAELSLTRTSVLIGSPLYMSPEQMRSAKDVDTRTDIWSLGVILYEMLTGRPPYTGDSIPALCASLLNDTPVSMRAFRSDIPLELEAVVFHCLAKDREQRFSTVSELAYALAPFASLASQVHVDRASRLMGITKVSVLSNSQPNQQLRGSDPGRLVGSDPGRRSGSDPGRLVGSDPGRRSGSDPGRLVGSDPGRRSGSDPGRLVGSDPGRPTHVSGGSRAVPVRRTIDSWGRTDAPSTGNTPAQKQSRGLVYLGAGLALAALLSVLLFIGMRQPSAPPSASASVAAKAPPLRPAQVGEPRGVVPQPEPEVLPSAIAPEPSAPVVKPLDVKPNKQVVVALPTFKPKPPPASAPKPTGMGELSDFGGRR